jgi:hypothetical protein
MTKELIFKISFINNGKLYEMYAQKVCQSGLFGFIEVEEYIFGENSSIVIDPSEDRLKKEFNGVKRSYIPINSVIRIDEVEKKGVSKISKLSENSSSNVITPFPNSTILPPESGSDS